MFADHLFANFQSWKIVFLLIILPLSHSASIMTLSSKNSHQFELLSNRSYRNFYLRQHFIDVLNTSHSSLIQSMIEKHQLLMNLEESAY